MLACNAMNKRGWVRPFVTAIFAVTLAILAVMQGCVGSAAPITSSGCGGDCLGNLTNPAQYYNGKTYVAFAGEHSDCYIMCYNHSSKVWRNQ